MCNAGLGRRNISAVGKSEPFGNLEWKKVPDPENDESIYPGFITQY
jgi:hypothetical protein